MSFKKMNNKILWKLDTVCDKLQLVVMHRRVALSRDFTDHPHVVEMGMAGLGLKMEQGL